MVPTSPAPGNLVVYKSRPARVEEAEGDKLLVRLDDGGTKRVRPKDVVALHPGPVESLRSLNAGNGEMEEAWEMAAGEELSLADLAELAYGAFTPATAWSSWETVADGLLFEGEPDSLRARDPETVAADRERREARQRAAAERRALLARLREGRTEPEDAPALTEVERLALGNGQQSPLMRELGREETPEEAHRLLLDVGYWQPLTDPYPARNGAPEGTPEVAIPDLPEEERADLTHLAAWAIDDAGNTDPDDAVSVDGDRIWVHVADPAAAVAPDSEPDAAARERGTTLYLPDGPRPMLSPAAVDRFGLGLADTSPALSFGFRVDDGGELTDIEVVPSRVRVTRLSYEAAEERLDDHPLTDLAPAAERFRARRLEQGAVELALPDVQVRLEDGEIRLRPLPELASRRLVMEAMIMAGRAAALFAQAEGLVLPFATQPPPAGEASGEGLAGAYALRRLLRPSRVQLDPEPHSGLGLPAYAQATSPLRRYPDLVAHQQLRAHLAGHGAADREAIDARMAGVGERLRTVRRTERLSNQHYKLIYLQRLGEWHGQGVVVERAGPKGKVLIPELALEASIALPDSFQPGDAVDLRLTGVDLPALEARFRVEKG